MGRRDPHKARRQRKTGRSRQRGHPGRRLRIDPRCCFPRRGLWRGQGRRGERLRRQNALAGAPAARSEDPAARVGASTRPAGAPLSRDRPVWSRPCSGIHDFRRSAGLYACRGKRLCQAPRRASGGGGVHRARGHWPRESPRRPKGCRVNSGPGPETSCGFAALIGAPNAGKSTLINQLVGTKVSIVSRKVQTTRGTVRGIALEGTAQIIYVDTPGIFAPKRRLDRAMVGAAWGGAADADAAALLVDAHKGIDAEVEAILARLPRIGAKKILVLNKIDTVEPPKLLELAAKLNGALPFADTFMISALRGHGVAKLKQSLGALMPPGPWLYPED